MHKCKQCGSESEEPKTCCDQPMEEHENHGDDHKEEHKEGEKEHHEEQEHHEEKCEGCGNAKNECTCGA